MSLTQLETVNLHTPSVVSDSDSLTEYKDYYNYSYVYQPLTPPAPKTPSGFRGKCKRAYRKIANSLTYVKNSISWRLSELFEWFPLILDVLLKLSVVVTVGLLAVHFWIVPILTVII